MGTSDLYELAKGRRLTALILARAHAAVRDKSARLHRQLGLGVVILTTLVGTGAFANLVNLGKTQIWAAILTAVLSLAAAVLSAVQTSLDYKGAVLKHADAAARLNAIARELDLALVEHDPKRMRESVEKLDYSMTVIINNAPSVSADVQKEAERAINEEEGAAQAAREWREAFERAHPLLGEEPDEPGTTSSGGFHPQRFGGGVSEAGLEDFFEKERRLQRPPAEEDDSGPKG